MRFCRFLHLGALHFGVIRDGRVHPVDDRAPFELNVDEGESIDLQSVQLVAPVVPGKIIGVGRNYADHAAELGNEIPKEPLIFFKPPSAVIGPDDEVKLPAISERVDFEGELAIVIGREARNVSAANWRDYVFGFTCADDVTARDLQKKDGQFTRGKGFDTFCPIGPWIETELDVSDILVETKVNGELKQHCSTSSLIFGPGRMIEFITEVMTLFPGDVILTGTPSGVAPLKSGDVVEVSIAGIGTLRHRVATG